MSRGDDDLIDARAADSGPGGVSRRGLLLPLVAFVAVVTLPAPALLLVCALALGARIAHQGAIRLPLPGRRVIGLGRQPRVIGARSDGLLLGETTSGHGVVLPDSALAAHGLILGASGAGKSTTMLAILGEEIARGRPAVVVDLKGSPTFADELRTAAWLAGRRFHHWTPDGGAGWNPLAHGSATELKDKLIATERFTEPHYQRAAERYLQTAIQVLRESRPSDHVSLERVVRLLDPDRLLVETRRLSSSRREHVHDYVGSLAPDQLSAVRGLAARLAILTESDTGRYLRPGRDGERRDGERDNGDGRRDRDGLEGGGLEGDGYEQIDLRRALREGEVVLFSLNSSTYGRLSAQIGTLVVQDLVSVAGARLSEGAERQPAVVAIDEFSALQSDNVMALLARGRESGIGVLLATQELADLDRAARGLRDQVLGNTAVKIAHRQDVPESAEAVAKLAGTVRVWDRTYHEQSGRFGTGGVQRTSVRQVDRYAVEPRRVQTLRTGEAVVIVKSPQASVKLTRVLPARMASPNPAGRRGAADRGRRAGCDAAAPTDPPVR